MHSILFEPGDSLCTLEFSQGAGNLMICISILFSPDDFSSIVNTSKPPHILCFRLQRLKGKGTTVAGPTFLLHFCFWPFHSPNLYNFEKLTQCSKISNFHFVWVCTCENCCGATPYEQNLYLFLRAKTVR